MPPPALFVREVTPGGIAAKTGLVDKGLRFKLIKPLSRKKVALPLMVDN